MQAIDYYPYGSKRIDQNTTSFVEKRQFIGQYYDPDTQLSYLNARYYESTRGQFLSEDPVFWEAKQNLQDPQSLNSYSYGEGNPIVKKDPNGQEVITAVLTAPLWVPIA